MKVAVIGANGAIGHELVPRLADAGHEPIGVVHDESQFDAVRERGGEPRYGDLKGEFAPARKDAPARLASGLQELAALNNEHRRYSQAVG